MAEIAVHVPYGLVPDDYSIVSIEVPDVSIIELPQEVLPADWKQFPHPESTKSLGDSFVREGLALAFRVPSAVVLGEYNYLINPGHHQISMVKITSIEPFEFDERLFRRQ